MKMMPTVALMIASAFLLSSCASTIKPAPAAGELVVVILPATHVQIVQATARQDGENVVVEGFVKRKKVHGRVIPKGHVDIGIVDQQGRTILQIPASCMPEIIPRMDGLKSSFMARIPVLAPRGSFVSVKFHSGSHGS